jgi:hypothetical protein
LKTVTLELTGQSTFVDAGASHRVDHSEWEMPSELSELLRALKQMYFGHFARAFHFDRYDTRHCLIDRR